MSGSRQADVNLMAQRSKANISFTYIRLGTIRATISYKGRANHHIADFQNLHVRIKRIVYQKKTWTIEKFANRLKRGVRSLQCFSIHSKAWCRPDTSRVASSGRRLERIPPL